MSKSPAFQWYPGDHRRDAAVQTCCLAARGLWMEMLGLMFDGTPCGHLTLNAQAMTTQQLARLVGAGVGEVSKLLVELEQAGVFSRTEAGVIYSRRMVRDDALRKVRAAAGKLGGNPALLNQKDKQADKQGTNQRAKQEATPSSSSSSSASPPSSTTQEESASKPRRSSKPEQESPSKPDDVSEQVWNDWLALRSDKRAAVSKTVVTAARKEAGKAGLSLEDFFSIWCLRGSQGLQADWLKPEEKRAAKSFRQADEERAKAKFNEWGGTALQPSNVIDMQESKDGARPLLS